MIRISGGNLKGKKIKTLDTMSTRPTLSRVKTSLFDMLSDRIKDAVILDLYSGTGNIGIEALSRGAKRVIFVENNPGQARLIKGNLSMLNLLDSTEVITGDVFEAIQTLDRRAASVGDAALFDIIYLAPPFLKGLVCPTIKAIAKSSLLSPEGLLGVEHHKKETLPLPEAEGGRQKMEGRRWKTEGGSSAAGPLPVCCRFAAGSLPVLPPALYLTKQRRYGDIVVSFFTRKL